MNFKMTLYKIAKWADTYETHETRKLVRLAWIKVPNKHDGLGFRMVSEQKDGAALLAAWVLMVQLASKSDRETRGTLSREGIPLDADGMALMTGFPAKIFSRALAFFSQTRIGWLLAEHWQTDLPLSPGVPGESPDVPGFPPGRKKGKKEGKEEKDQKVDGPASPVVLPFASDAFRTAWEQFEQHRRQIRKPLTQLAAKFALEMLERIGEQRAVDCIRHTIEKGWQGLREREGPAPVAARTQKTAPTEPGGWKTYLNHEYPDSVYSAGGKHEAHKWADLPTDTQWKIINELKRQ